jgi:hypothetical protein
MLLLHVLQRNIFQHAVLVWRHSLHPLELRVGGQMKYLELSRDRHPSFLRGMRQ